MATSAPSIFPALAQLDIKDVLAHMPGGFFIYRAEGDEEVVYTNEACLRIFGCDDEAQFAELTGNTFPGMVHPDDIDAVEHSISRQIQADEYSMDYVEYRIIRRDGSLRWIEDYGHHVTLDEGTFFYVFINDATEKLRERADELEAINAQLSDAYAREIEHRTMLRNALSEAEAANVAKNAFLSNMSHDIRTPLNAVVGYASLISAHGEEAERVRSYSDKVLAASEQLLDVVNETLEISRMESGNVQLAEAECSLSELVMQVRRDLVDMADRADITLECDIEPLVHDRVIVDAVRLSHVLVQLVDNAIKYSPTGSTVRLMLSERADAPQGLASFRFVVADEGIGMDPSFMERMFMPFERESNTTASGVQGTGLGLTIVRNVLDLMEGNLSAESAPGEGSTFTVDITFRQAPTGAASEAQHPRRKHGPVRHILLVEDNELNREIACCLLDDAGYTVDTAENGAVALEMIEGADARTYDLVLMDIQMPVMDGYTATRAIRKLSDPVRASLPIIAVSANAFSEDRKRSLESGMDAHLSKPLDVHRLQSLIETVA